MNRYFYLLASTLFIFACSDDNSTSPSENQETAGYQHVSIDKENRRIFVNEDAHTEEYCILEQGSFNWGEVSYKAYQDSNPTTYEIHGDTLIVFFYGNTYDPHYYLGGSTDKIYGKWINIGCSKYQDEVYCQPQEDRDFREQYDEFVLTISENKFQEEIVYKPAYFEYDDYMNSMYLSDLYAVLENNYAYPTIGSFGALFSPEQESYIKAVEKERNIEVLEQTKTMKKFKLGGKIFELKITDIERDSLDYRVAISVKSGDKECSYEEQQVNATKENCKDQTTEGLRYYDEERDFQYPLYFRDANMLKTKGRDEFDKCIKEITVSKDTQNGTQTDKADATDSIQTLEAFLEKYDITDYSFDKNVLAYNETSGYCDALQNTCFEAPGISEFRTLGLHRFEANDITALTTIFPHAAAAMNNKIEGCPLYVLNISDTSPAIHILTNITKDTITIVNISDECAYEPRPFDMNVGFLFTYCDELSENPEVVTTQVLDDKMECGTIEYAEYISEKHTNEAFMADMRKAQAEFKKLKAAAKPAVTKAGKK